MLDQQRYSLVGKYFKKELQTSHLSDPQKICGFNLNESRAYYLLPFVKEVQKMLTNQQILPDYEKLLFLLEKPLLDMGTIPKQNYNLFMQELQRKNEAKDLLF